MPASVASTIRPIRDQLLGNRMNVAITIITIKPNLVLITRVEDPLNVVLAAILNDKIIAIQAAGPESSRNMTE